MAQGRGQKLRLGGTFVKYSVSLENCPVIAAAKNEEQLDAAIGSGCEIIFLLFGDILNIASLTEKVYSAGKVPMVHIDLVNGLASRDIAVDFIEKTTKAAGIITTKLSFVKRAKELGLFTVLRVFAIDSRALENIRRELTLVRPDVFEILPGIIPDVIAGLTKDVDVPIIAGGLVASKQDIMRALQAGAAAVSTTDNSLWDI